MKNRRGMMMVVAIALLGLIGVALASITNQIGADYHRLQMQTNAAQARQILIAATQSLLRDPEKSFTLPAALLESGSAVKISPILRSSSQATFRLDAISGRIHLSEMLSLTSTPPSWTIAEIELQ